MTQVYAGSPTQGQSRPGPAFVATAPAVAAHPGLEPLGARLDRPGLRRRHLLRRGASRAGAARCPVRVGPAGAPPRRNSGRCRQGPGWPGPAFVFAVVAAVAVHSRPERPGARPDRPSSSPSSPPPPSRRIPGRRRPGPGLPGPAFVFAVPAVAAHPGPEPPWTRGPASSGPAFGR
jgi:hypothetical protein